MVIGFEQSTKYLGGVTRQRAKEKMFQKNLAVIWRKRWRGGKSGSALQRGGKEGFTILRET